MPATGSQQPAASAVGSAVAVVVIGTALLALGTAGLIMWSQAHWFTLDPPYPSTWVGSTPAQNWWLLVFVVCTPSGFGAFVAGSSALVRVHGNARAVFAVVQAGFGVISVVVGALGVGVWGGRSFMGCAAIFCSGNVTAAAAKADSTKSGLGWQGVVGTAAFLSLVPMGLLLIHAAHRHAASPPFSADMAAPNIARDRIAVAAARHQTIVRNMVLIAMMLLFWAYCGTLLSDSWDWTAVNLAKFASTRIPAATDGNATMTAKCMGQSSLYVCPEYPWALMRSIPIEVSPTLILKLYPENMALYAYLLAVLLIGAALAHLASPRTKHSLGRPFAPSWFGPLGWRPSRANAVVAGATFVLVVLWIVYWLHDHNFNNDWKPSNAKFPQGMPMTERIARAAGQTAVLFLSLLMFGTARHGTLHQVLGTSFERTINAHKLLGYLMLAALVVHVAMWAKRYSEWGLSAWALFAEASQSVESKDNFTIPLSAYSTLLLFVAMGALALDPVRRRAYEVFYFSHLVAAWTTLPVTLWHATMSWEFMLPGLTLWFFDRLLRMHRSNARCTILRAAVIHDAGAGPSDDAQPPRSGNLGSERSSVTELTFVADSRALQASRPGQYVYVNVPELSVLEWHPFTLSHCATAEPAQDNGGNYLSLHIRAMGAGTWTDRLQALVAAHVQPDGTLPPGTLTLAVDGPCGEPFDWSGYTDVMLVAGGVGVTPVACIFDALKREREGFGALAETAALVSSGGQRKLRALWLLREPSLINSALGDSLAPPSSTTIAEAESTTRPCFADVRAHVFVTRAAAESNEMERRLPGDDAETSAVRRTVGCGRPDVSRVLAEELALDGRRRPLVFVCGPPSLVSDVVAWCDARAIAVHSEAFLL